MTCPSPDTMYISSPTIAGLDLIGPGVSTVQSVAIVPDGPGPTNSPVRPGLPLYIWNPWTRTGWLGAVLTATPAGLDVVAEAAVSAVDGAPQADMARVATTRPASSLWVRPVRIDESSLRTVVGATIVGVPRYIDRRVRNVGSLREAIGQ